MKSLRDIVPLDESLGLRPQSSLMRRAVANMKKRSDIDSEFAEHNEKIKGDTRAKDAIEASTTGHAFINRKNRNVGDFARATSHPLSQPITTFRGLDYRDPLHSALLSSRPGDVHAIRNSTAFKRVVPKSWAGLDREVTASGRPVGSILVLHNLPGTRYGYPDTVLHRQGYFARPSTERLHADTEHELTLHPNTKAVHLGSEKIGDVWHHHLETIPPRPARLPK